MDGDKPILEPAFDFNDSEVTVLLSKSQAEVCINGNTYTGDGEVRLELLPRACICLYGIFPELPMTDALMVMSGQQEVSFFSINGHQVEGFPSV